MGSFFCLRIATALALASLITSAAFSVPEASEKLPKACTKDGNLEPGENGVVHRKGGFNRQNNHHPFEVFGLGQLNPTYKTKPFKMCMRYEALNPDDQEILERFHWEDARIERYDLAPGEQLISGPFHKKTYYDFTDTENTTVQAFEASDDLTEVTQSAFTVEEAVEKRKTAQLDKAKPFNLALMFPDDVLDHLTAAGIKSRTVLAFDRPHKRTTFPILVQGFKSTIVDFNSTSISEYIHDGSVLYIETRIAAEVSHSPISAPYLLALYKYSRSSADISSPEEAIVEFVNYLQEFKNDEMSLESGTFERKVNFELTDMFGDSAIFIVDHTITFRNEGRIACIRTQTYSPVPISINGSFCGS
jgi:hypothetical protein